MATSAKESEWKPRLQKGYRKIRKLLEQQPKTLDFKKGGFVWRSEIDWRWRHVLNQPHPLLAWADPSVGGESSADLRKNAVKSLELSWQAADDLRNALAWAEGNGETETIGLLKDALLKAADLQSADPVSDEERKEVIKRWRKGLERLSDWPDARSGRRFEKHWPILSLPLAVIAPKVFFFVRPSVMNGSKTPVASCIFGADGLKYDSAATVERALEYIKRARYLSTLLANDGCEPGEYGLFGVSAWVIAADGALREKHLSDEVVRLMEDRHVILQGPPGTGKTHMAERLAVKLAGESGKVVELDRYEKATEAAVVKHFVQFHASYDYEDFVRGFRPRTTNHGVSFELKDGPFARMATLAMRNPETKFLLVIDEINRADLARVLGECIYLLDRRPLNPSAAATSDKGIGSDDVTVEQAWTGSKPGAATLRYSPEGAPEQDLHAKGETGDVPLLPRICVPSNLYIVGTMNTADRSIAIVDVALRRRFAFVDVGPEPEVVRDILRSSQTEADEILRVLGWLERLNGSPEDETSAIIADPRFYIGHAYFLQKDPRRLRQAVRYQVIPLLEEYNADGRIRDDGERFDTLLKDMRKFTGAQ